MTTDTDLRAQHLLPEELSRAQQSVRLGEAHHQHHQHNQHDRVTQAYLLGYKARLVLGRLI
jgi:hypothetical protein